MNISIRLHSISGLTCLCLIGCGAKEDSEFQTQASEPTLAAPPSAEPASPSSESGPAITISGDPILQGGTGVPPNTSGITPMDVVSGVPAPTNPAVQADARQQPPIGEEATSPNIPSGIPLPDFSGIVGHSNYRIESVTMGTAAPGEGPVGPDGKVIDPNTFLGPAEPSVGQDPQPTLLPASGAVGVEGRKLDPSEAPKLPQGP